MRIASCARWTGIVRDKSSEMWTLAISSFFSRTQLASIIRGKSGMFLSVREVRFCRPGRKCLELRSGANSPGVNDIAFKESDWSSVNFCFRYEGKR